MRLFILVLLFVFATRADLACTRERIINCMLEWVDRDQDGRVSADDINNFYTYRPCGRADPSSALGEHVVANVTDGGCDTDGSGYLEEIDFDNPGGCMRVDALQLYLCNKCTACEEYNAP
jgi:hypothetical protein